MRLWGSRSTELALGQEFQLRNAGATGIVGKQLGAGGQGSVYLCDVGGRQLALKWYKPEVCAGDRTVRERIEALVSRGPPDKRFLFPIDIAIIPGSDQFGYVMPVVSPDRRQISEILAAPPKQLDLSLEVRATACYEIADAFLQLHAAGLSYQDVNFGAFFVDPIRGGIVVCDPDNITVEGLTGGVLGAPRFMAPEIVRREALPSARTDLYSMAVLFFYTLFHCHPLRGRREVEAGARTAETELALYGTEPLFMFDPDNDANGPIPGTHDWVVARWRAMPAGLRELFTRSFTRGLHDPDERVVETEWRAGMARLRDAVTRCKACAFEIPLDLAGAGAAPPSCPACGACVPRPLRMTLGRYLVSMLPARNLYAHHVDATAPLTLRDSVATVDVHPNDATVVGLRNLTPSPWQGRTGDGKPVTVVPGRTVRILDGLGIDFGRREGLVAGADRAEPSPA